MNRVSAVILAFLLVCGALMVSPAAGFLHFLFPGLAVVAGLLLFKFSADAYISFTLWIWFLTPFIRRVVDYRSSYLDPSPMLLAPLLVTTIAALGIFKKMATFWRTDFLPHLLAIAALLYGLFVGMITDPISDLIRNSLLWFVPAVWGFYLMGLHEKRDRMRTLIATNFKWAFLLLGAYGVLQYVSLPIWDSEWLRHAIEDRNSTSFGSSGADQVRVWSTMNGPGIFANFAMTFLVIACADTGLVEILAILVGGLAFLLAQVRAAWIGAAMATMCLVVWQRSRRFKLISSLLVIGLALSGLACLPQFQDTLFSRFQSMGSVQEDGSFQERKATQERLIGTVETHPFGMGLAPKLTDRETGGFAVDSGIFWMMLTLGWPGTLILSISLALLVARCFKDLGQTTFLCIGFRALLAALLIELPFGDVLTGPAGFLLWTAVALSDLTGAPARLNFSPAPRPVYKGYSNATA